MNGHDEKLLETARKNAVERFLDVLLGNDKATALETTRAKLKILALQGKMDHLYLEALIAECKNYG